MMEYPRPRLFPLLVPRPVEFSMSPAPPPGPPQRSTERIRAEAMADSIIDINDDAVNQYNLAAHDPLQQQSILFSERQTIESYIQSYLPRRSNAAVKKLAAEHIAQSVYAINTDTQNRLLTASPDQAVDIRDQQKKRLADALEPHIDSIRRGGFFERMKQTTSDRRLRRGVAGGFAAGLLVSALAVGAYALHERNTTQPSPQTLAPGICKTLPTGSIAVAYDSTLDGAKVYNDPSSAAVIELFKPGVFCAGSIRAQYQIVNSTDPGLLNAIANNYRVQLQQSGCSGGYGCTYVTTIIDR